MNIVGIFVLESYTMRVTNIISHVPSNIIKTTGIQYTEYV